MKHIVFDGKDAVLGRIGTRAAKELLKGSKVSIINAEGVIISTKKAEVVNTIQRKRRMGAGGSLKGPTYIRQSDRLLKRMIRGMLPWEKTKGREAYKRLRCYVGEGGLPADELKNAVKLNHRKPMNYTTMKAVVGALRA